MVNWENYEEYMLLLADGELDEGGKAALMAFVAQHPELKKELDLYQATVLVPDMEMVYADKSSLTKHAPAKTIALRSWWAYGAAAGVAAIIGFLALTNNSTPSGLVVTKPIDTMTIKITANERQKQQLITNNQKPATNNQYQASNIKHQTSGNKQPASQQRTPDLLAALPTNMANKMSANTIIASPEAHSTTLNTITPAQEDLIEGKQPLAWLPIADEQKQSLLNLKDAVDNTLEKVQSIKDTKVVFKIGNKNLLAFNL